MAMLGEPTTRRARKWHRCMLCGYGIAPGCSYVRWAWADGGVVECKAHVPCDERAKTTGAYNQGEEWHGWLLGEDEEWQAMLYCLVALSEHFRADAGRTEHMLASTLGLKTHMERATGEPWTINQTHIKWRRPYAYGVKRQRDGVFVVRMGPDRYGAWLHGQRLQRSADTPEEALEGLDHA